MDVSRRLRARRLSRLARERAQRPLCCLAVPIARPGPFRSGYHSCTSRSVRNRLLCRSSRSWRRLSLLQRTLRPSTLYCQRTAVALCFHPLSPGAVCFARVGQEMNAKKKGLKGVAETMLIRIRFPRVLLVRAFAFVCPSLLPRNAQDVEPFKFFRDYVGLERRSDCGNSKWKGDRQSHRISNAG